MSIGDMGRPTARFRLWLGQPVNAPFVTPPFSLRIVLFLCIVSALATIIYALALQIRVGDPVYLSTSRMIVIACLYVVTPISTAITISNNRKLSRPLIILFLGGVAHLGYLSTRSVDRTTAQEWLVYGAIGALGIAVLWWLFLSKKLRVYYALISGKKLPAALQQHAMQIMEPGVVERGLYRVAQLLGPITEFLLLLIAIFVAIAGLWII